MSYSHIPVLLNEVLQFLDPQPGENLIDGTVGGGGHSKAILEKTGPDGKLLGIDMDAEAIEACRMNLDKFENRIILERDNYLDFKRLKEKNDFESLDLFFLDLGISSKQLDDEMLGISFLKNSPLDMRLGGEEITGGVSAEKILNSYSEEKIFDIIKNYGEERYAKLIAREIVKVRKEKRIESTKELVDIISDSVPGKYKHGRIHFATRTFQALRIAVNAELINLEKVLPQILEEMEVGGRIGIISFHSLEDRIVKRFFATESRDCICGPEVPVCVCGHQKRLQLLTKKPARASLEEMERNPRARSAKLRVAKKII
ncbi:MAG: 16S rRNA (cytosine(1402)-N(4))-methyltransferase RsmH [Candidatus Pacebacteria bacterium]|nr:16S rRNA (cytosine(1402)-N(4))-methyltransferase RsmH [Candidatus Paceibacterota bacterium]